MDNLYLIIPLVCGDDGGYVISDNPIIYNLAAIWQSVILYYDLCLRGRLSPCLFPLPWHLQILGIDISLFRFFLPEDLSGFSPSLYPLALPYYWELYSLSDVCFPSS